MRPVRSLRRTTRNIHTSTQMLSEIREGTANQSSLLNEKLSTLIAVCQNLVALQQSQLELLSELAQGKTLTSTDAAFGRVRRCIDTTVEVHDQPATHITGSTTSMTTFTQALRSMPLLLDDKTYNTAHPDYDAAAVRNFPGRILNQTRPCNNSVYTFIRAMATRSEVPDAAWSNVLRETLEEARTVPHADQVFERKSYIEDYLSQLGTRYKAHYVAGWVNLEDALFLYWLVRRLKPKTIVQTGVCNGLSSAFMMLALVKNGPDGKLYVIDLPAIFDPRDPAWTVANKVYGVVIPEGKASGWMVPDAYRDRLDVLIGDARLLLPKVVDELDSIDMFYHDSDHTYAHMMFEFREARRKLRPGGLIVADDISWNASLWEFADECRVPSYNYKGAVGVAFL